jgi:outer membrane scaffolding protein for murein synthesis (MipA/OmpV family)
LSAQSSDRSHGEIIVKRTLSATLLTWNILGFLSAWLAAVPETAMAQTSTDIPATVGDALDAPSDETASDWRFSIGAGAVVSPRFIGAKKLRTRVLPLFDIRYHDWFFASPIRGIGLEVKPIAGLSLTAALGADFSSRNSNEDPRMHGLAKIDLEPALKLGAEYEFHDFAFRAELSKRIASSAKGGAKARFEEGYNFVANQKFILTAGVFQEVMDRTYANNFISISNYQSSVTHLAPYNAKSGLLDGGVYAQALYRITDKWVLFTKADYARLAKNPGESPIVQRKNQAMLLFVINRSF